ncbi:MAG: thiol oxidoreductase [Candidatus Latescibacteria bacterium]|jgi:CxxC motif-containing protein (DUF1111 family)|nr:thiol oxidoreductase [Candidatus Latescibacterota bacterium]
MPISPWPERWALSIFIFLSVASVFTTSCENLLTEAPNDGDLLETPLPNLTRELQIMFNKGDANFEATFSVVQGLGPLFNNASCGACHPGDGRGPESVTFQRFTEPGGDPRKNGEPQLQQFAIPGVSPESLPAGSLTSPRTAPPVFGVGLIESIPEATILSNEDAADTDGDGISGKANMVPAPPFVPPTEIGGGPGLHVGRFGLKANNASLLAQTVGAYLQDMGITSDFAPEETVHPLGNGVTLGDNVPDPEISAATVQQTVMYVRLLSPPDRGPITAEVQAGEQVFTDLNCQTCHIPTMQTGPSGIPQLSNVPVNLYSDLLLHDMGTELADGRPDEQASGSEWKTRPLWGLRLIGDFLGGNSNYMHDGRAATLDAAIRLHGGEAHVSSDGYVALSDTDRNALIAFLNSL